MYSNGWRFKSARMTLTKVNSQAYSFVKYYEFKKYISGEVEKSEEKGNILRTIREAGHRL